LPIALVPVLYMYLISERRAAFNALLAAFDVLGAFLLWTRPSGFRKVAPIVVVVLTIYTAAFWNNESSSAGFPAQAIKSVVSPTDVSDRNQDSDLYRIIEKYDIVATIRSSPILGIGFGHAFLRPVTLPPINVFLLSPYMPHNAILWIWMKVGAVGFLSMVFLFGLAMLVGTRTILRMPWDDYAAITLTSLAFILMFAIFSYVDISWDPQNMVILALAMAQIDSAARLAGVRPDVRASANERTPALLDAELATFGGREARR
jgi:O-antigen ligase